MDEVTKTAIRGAAVGDDAPGRDVSTMREPRVLSLGRSIAFVVAWTALLAVAARVSIPLPFSPVPVTGQTLVVLLIGAFGGPGLGATTVLIYIAEGAIGLPVFAAGGFGLAQVLGPTGGYLVGFVFAAAVIGWLDQRGWTRSTGRLVVAMLVSEVALYVAGLAWLSRSVPAAGLFSAGLLPFVAGDLYKVILATTIVRSVRRRSWPFASMEPSGPR